MNSSAPARRAISITCARGIAGSAKAISANGAVEQQVLLQHDADMAAQPRGVDLAEVGPIHQNLPLAGR